MESEMRTPGEILRDWGMQKAIDHALRVEPTWADNAWNLLLDYAKKRHHFQAESIRAYARLHNFPEPPDARAWGVIIREGVKQGILQPTHYAPTIEKASHCRPMMVWKSTLYQRQD